MSDQLPKFHEVFIPMLKVLSSGHAIRTGELRKRVRDEYYSDLSEELLARKTKSGDQLVLNRIGWAKAYLKDGGYVTQPARGTVQITPKGLAAAEAGQLSLQQLKSDPDYIATRREKEEAQTKNSEYQALDNATPQDLIDDGVSAIEENVKQELLQLLKSADPYYFEEVILQLLRKMGYGEFESTPKSRDGGIDGIINQDQLGLQKIYIQAKRYTENNVREHDIRNFIGAMSGDTTNGVFVTTSSFHDGAVKKARDAHHKIALIDGDGLVDLMYQFGVGVQTQSTYLIKKVDHDFFDADD